MNFELKHKITVTEDFLNELIMKSWQDAEAIQQQIANIDTSTSLGVEVVNLLRNTCTSYYVLAGCLEALVENPEISYNKMAEREGSQVQFEPESCTDSSAVYTSTAEEKAKSIETTHNFEPFEYFVDFDEPSGEPISDQDLYN